jgi:hypothetical protein
MSDTVPTSTPPSIEGGDIPRLALVAQLAALLSLAGGDGYSSRQAHQEAAHLVCRASPEDRRAAADYLDRDAERLDQLPRARWCRAAAAYLRGLDRPEAP